MPTFQQQVTAHVRRWFRQSGWKSFPFQQETWQAYLRGDHGLVHAPTGTGKTLSVFLGPVIEWLAENKETFRQLKREQKERINGSLDCYSSTAHMLDIKSQDAISKTVTSVAVAVNPEPPKKRTSIEKLNRVKRKRRRLTPLNPNSMVQVLWVTPLRALATDTETSLTNTITSLGVHWQIEKRTGDTDTAVRTRQRKQFPEVLITTPEA